MFVNFFLSIFPPLLSITLAILFRQVIIALFAGIWAGVLILCYFNPFDATLRVLDTYFISSIATPDHIKVLVFTFVIGGMVGVMTKSGGAKALGDAISRLARSRRSAQLLTTLSGSLIFFDDYANCYIVGTTARPFTDKLRISREKLAYIVDTTAAADACIVLISTWVGYQISFLATYTQNYYRFFLEMIPYCFYSLFTIAFIYLICLTLRDFGPMLKAERRAYSTGKLLGDNAVALMDIDEIKEFVEVKGKARAINAVFPIVAIVVAVIAGLYFSGYAGFTEKEGDMPRWYDIAGIISNTKSFDVLVWASFLGSICALLIATATGALSITRGIEAWVSGCKSMFNAAIILCLAWTLSEVCKKLALGENISALIIKDGEVLVPIQILPAVIFIACCGISFATGTSWGTMGIMFPVIIPVLQHLRQVFAHEPYWYVVEHCSFAAILSGAVFGDHISPISDTTILSSAGSACDHIDHVKTQAPYGILCAVVALMVGYIPVCYGLPVWLSLLLGILLLFIFLRFAGKRVEDI